MVSDSATTFAPNVQAPDEASKNTASAVVGTLAPLPPPEAVDQLAVLDPSQVPEPTQYLFAIPNPYQKPNTLPTNCHFEAVEFHMNVM
jgi:hypothetical protein